MSGANRGTLAFLPIPVTVRPRLTTNRICASSEPRAKDHAPESTILRLAVTKQFLWSLIHKMDVTVLSFLTNRLRIIRETKSKVTIKKSYISRAAFYIDCDTASDHLIKSASRHQIPNSDSTTPYVCCPSSQQQGDLCSGHLVLRRCITSKT